MEYAGQPAIDCAQIPAERLEYRNLTCAVWHMTAAHKCRSRGCQAAGKSLGEQYWQPRISIFDVGVWHIASIRTQTLNGRFRSIPDFG
jgi:hypothetical protein